jgi:hypothetical protein
MTSTNTTIDQTDTMVLSIEDSTTNFQQNREENDSTSVCQIHSLGVEVSNPDNEEYWENKYKNDYTGILSGRKRVVGDNYTQTVFLEMMETIKSELSDTIRLGEGHLNHILNSWDINQSHFHWDKMNQVNYKIYDSSLFDTYVYNVLVHNTFEDNKRYDYNFIRLFVSLFQDEKWCKRFVRLIEDIDYYNHLVSDGYQMIDENVDKLKRYLLSIGLCSTDILTRRGDDDDTILIDNLVGSINTYMWNRSVKPLENKINTTIDKLVSSIPHTQNYKSWDERIKYRFSPSESQRKILWEYLVSTPYNQGNDTPLMNCINIYWSGECWEWKNESPQWGSISRYNDSHKLHLKFYILNMLDTVYSSNDIQRMNHLVSVYLNKNSYRFM